MKVLKYLLPLLIIIIIGGCAPAPDGNTVTMSKVELQDKIKGAWAAQTIGVTYGSPVEFKYNSTMIPADTVIPWYDGYLKDTYDNTPGFYDDIYMDLTFVQVLDNEGMDAPAQSFANAFANADYYLWFANQQSRHNILNGITPPASGHWLNNPCADDIDYQIEADFAGIMNPGMPNSASAISDRVGHIMNYGDGWYGGVYVGALYSLAFVNDDIEFIVEEALKTIPEQSTFAQTIADVIAWHKEDPTDWKANWTKVNAKWANEIGSPYGVFEDFNIDAKINAAWVVMGLLYGDGDFTKTFEIATRCGDDADCNPASAGGVLGTIVGYDAIPDYWKQGLAEVEPIDFKYTTISLNDAYEMSFNHALEMIKRNGGSITEKSVNIPVQKPETVPLEVAFEGHYPKEKIPLQKALGETLEFEFDGIAFVVTGEAKHKADEDDERGSTNNYVFEVDVTIDGEFSETIKLPTAFKFRRFYLIWKYQLPEGHHTVQLKLKNPTDIANVNLDNVLIYDSKPLATK